MRKTTKAILVFFLTMAMMMSVIACGTKDENTKVESSLFTAGTYEGEADGYGGKVKVKVTVTSEKITDITVEADGETEGIGVPAVDIIVKSVLDAQNLNVDLVSGATMSSDATMQAIIMALEKAGADINALKTAKKQESTEKAQEDLDTDIVVIGAGGAGMAAAIEAKEAGKSVIIVEKMPIVGGNTNRATGGINAAGTKIQEDEGIEDSVDVFFADTLKGGKEINNKDLVQVMVDNSASAVEWLNELGAGLTRVSLSGGATNPRIHTPADGSAVGPVVVGTMTQKLKELGVTIMMETTAKEILMDGDKVTGILATDPNGNEFKINAKAVIETTGGFGANSEKVESYRSDLVGFSTTNHSGALGEGIDMGEKVGAALTDIKEIQIHPTTDPESGYMFTEGLRGDGAILVNQEGERFTNELGTRDVVSADILKQTGGIAYLITNEEMREDNGALRGYIEKGYAVEGADLDSLGQALQVDAETLKTTLSKYKSYVDNANDEDFSRDNMTVTLENGPYYALKVTPAIHHTMGGLTINTTAQVLNGEGNPIKGLYAAGEVTGGIHGANRIGGNAMTDIIVFGRIAGQTAASELK